MSDGAKSRSKSRKSALDRLARLITGPRAVVARAFDETVATKRRAVALEAIADQLTSDVETYARALERADAEGWLKNFCITLMNAGVVEEDFARQVTKLLDPPGAVRMQRTYDPYNVSFDPAVEGRLQLQSAPQLCRIDIDGKPAGTGFLVSSHLVLTGYHVVASLAPQGKALMNSHARLSMVFDDRRDLLGSAVTLLPSVQIAAATDWLAASSLCHPAERVGSSPNDDTFADQIDAEHGPWDYALIRLAKVLSVAYKGLQFGSLVEEKQRIVVYHHPQGKALVGTRGEVVGFVGRGVRFMHTANTKNGSSGGPCFDTEYKVVGIHQAGVESDNKRKKIPNRAVPIHPFRGKINAILADPPPEMTTIVMLDDGRPVIGRDDTQQWIWRAVPRIPPAPPGPGGRILVVKGEEGRGKKFTLDLMRTLLAGGAHIIIDLDAGNMVEDTPLSFARKLLAALHADASGLPANESLTTDLNWLKLTLMTEVRNAIEGVRGGRTVWIAIRYPRDGVLPEGSRIREALDALYGQALEVDWLRLVLLGLQIDLPDQMRTASTIEKLKALRAAEILAYFERRWTATGDAAKKASLKRTVDRIIKSVPGADDEMPPADYHNQLLETIGDYENLLRANLSGRS